MSKTTKTDPAAMSMIQNPESLPEFANFEEEQISLPPYWTPAEGKWFFGLVVDLDNRDPEFPRYLIQAGMELKCERGKKDEKEDVTVKKDEFFSLSAYGGLPLDRYIGVHVLVKAIGRKDVGRPQPMWEFSLKISPEDKKLLNEDRKRVAGEAIRRYRAMKANNTPQLDTGGI